MKKNNSEIKVITKNDLVKLAEKRIGGDFALSFYLGLKPEVNFRSEANSVLAGEIKKIKKSGSYSKKDKKKILKLVNAAKKQIDLIRLPAGARTIVVFCDGKNSMKIYRVPVYIRSMLIVEADYYIHPLLKAMEKFLRYMAAVVERNRAEFISIFLGEIEGEPEVMESDVPKKIRTSSSDDWKGRREQKIERHIEDHLHRHFKAIALKIQDYFKANKFDYLIIGGHKEMQVKLGELLDNKSAEKLIGFFTLPHYKREAVKEKSLAIINKHEKNIEEKITEDLMDGLSEQKWKAVAGADSVIKNILRRNASLLVIGKNYKEKGYACPACHLVSLNMKKCPTCKTKMTRAHDIADEIIEEALKNKIKIKQLFYDHKKFDRFGIGAFLKTY